MDEIEIIIDENKNQYKLTGDIENFWNKREIKSYLKDCGYMTGFNGLNTRLSISIFQKSTMKPLGY